MESPFTLLSITVVTMFSILGQPISITQSLSLVFHDKQLDFDETGENISNSNDNLNENNKEKVHWFNCTL